MEVSGEICSGLNTVDSDGGWRSASTLPHRSQLSRWLFVGQGSDLEMNRYQTDFFLLSVGSVNISQFLFGFFSEPLT